MLNDWNLPKMSALGTKCAGHEGAGVIVKVGSAVKKLKPGMRAGLKVHGASNARGIWADNKHADSGDSLSKTRAARASSVDPTRNATARVPYSPVLCATAHISNTLSRLNATLPLFQMACPTTLQDPSCAQRLPSIHPSMSLD